MAGFWQLRRAEEKRELFASFDAGIATAPLPLPATVGQIASLRYRVIHTAGRYDPAHQVLLDARTRGGQVGYEVLTPLIAPGQTVLVNRGWVPANPDRNRLPDVAVTDGERSVTGFLDRLPRAAITAGRAAQDSVPRWPLRMLFPTAAELSAALGYTVPDYQLLLAPAEPDGYLRNWRPAVMKPEQHLAYAVQWFALAAALAALYVVVNLRRAATGAARQ
jgi:surfeit locus 1 family protein